MKRYGQILVICMSACLFAGCGKVSAGKLEQAQGVYEELVSKHNAVIEVYANMEDDSFREELDSMANELNETGKRDIQNMSEEEIDNTIKELEENIVVYDDILSSMEQLTDQKAADNTFSVSVMIKNNTGVELEEIYLYKALQNEKGKNLAEDIENMDGYEVLSILNLCMTKEETDWRLEAIDKGGNIIESADVSFAGYENEDVTINMEYSFDDMDGWIELE